MKTLTIHRKSHRRKGYRRKDGTWVKGGKVAAATFKVKDRGRPGRGQKLVRVHHEGALGGQGYTRRSQVDRHTLLARSVRRDGYATTMQRLNALRVWGSRTMSLETRRKIERDMKWLRSRHGK